MSDPTGTGVHAHEVLHLIVGSAAEWTVDGLQRELARRFGADCRFESCSASGMDFDRLLQFLLERRKIAVVDGVVTADPSQICSHD